VYASLISSIHSSLRHTNPDRALTLVHMLGNNGLSLCSSHVLLAPASDHHVYTLTLIHLSFSLSCAAWCVAARIHFCSVQAAGWGGGGLLGVSIRYASFDGASEHVWHILDVVSARPCVIATQPPLTMNR
jgi:hypothetical protein